MIKHKVKINKGSGIKSPASSLKNQERKKKEARREKIAIGFLLLVLAFGVLVLFFTAKSMFFSLEKNNQITSQDITQMPAMSKMSLTPYDKELARQMMDKDGDGKCDVCGMPVEMCIESGQLQCNMDSDSTIGILQSQHIHTDFKVYINEEALDFTGKDHMAGMKSGSSVSSFIHVDSGAPAPEKTGDVLHMHATGVPLWIFFESIELELPEATKVYVNGELNSGGLNYVFNDLDKILITDGKGDLQEQLNSVTDFAGNH